MEHTKAFGIEGYPITHPPTIKEKPMSCNNGHHTEGCRCSPLTTFNANRARHVAGEALQEREEEEAFSLCNRILEQIKDMAEAGNYQTTYSFKESVSVNVWSQLTRRLKDLGFILTKYPKSAPKVDEFIVIDWSERQ